MIEMKIEFPILIKTAKPGETARYIVACNPDDLPMHEVIRIIATNVEIWNSSEKDTGNEHSSDC